MDLNRKQQRTLLALLLLFAAIAFVFLGCPIFVIRPFRMQGEHELALSLAVRSWAFVVTALCALLSSVTAAVLWQRARNVPKPAKYRVPALLLALFTLATCALTRVNIFEKMFHPVSGAQFVSAHDAPMKDSDMVMAVTVADEHRAYPISIMAYHHILNDVLAGVPLAVTY